MPVVLYRNSLGHSHTSPRTSCKKMEWGGMDNFRGWALCQYLAILQSRKDAFTDLRRHFATWGYELMLQNAWFMHCVLQYARSRQHTAWSGQCATHQCVWQQWQHQPSRASTKQYSSDFPNTWPHRLIRLRWLVSLSGCPTHHCLQQQPHVSRELHHWLQPSIPLAPPPRLTILCWKLPLCFVPHDS